MLGENPECTGVVTEGTALGRLIGGVIQAEAEKAIRDQSEKVLESVLCPNRVLQISAHLIFSSILKASSIIVR